MAPPAILFLMPCVCPLALSLSLQSVPRCKKVALYVYEEELMFWCSLVGADRPLKQAISVARQEDLGLCFFGRSLCRYYSPFHAVKKWHCMFRTGRVDVLVFFGRSGSPA